MWILKFEVTILGSGSATPTLRRSPTSQVINIQEQLFMVDCGEGAQLQLRRYKIKFQRINHIFISHLHGDHYLGLIGLLSSMHLLGRTKELYIYSHPDLREIIEFQLKASHTELNFELHFKYLNYKNTELILDNDVITVKSIVLKHRIDCCGFVFTEKEKERSIVKNKAMGQKIPVEAFSFLKKGQDFVSEEGVKYLASELTAPPPEVRGYAFCSDTSYNEKIVKEIEGVDLLYHEATFLNQLEDRAKKTFHSTSVQAAKIADLAKVKQLVLGHFSARYSDVSEFKKEAKEVFDNVILAEDGLKISIP